MNRLMRLLGWTISLGCLALGASHGVAQPASPPAVPRGVTQLPPVLMPSNVIPPTVTMEMGDVGGKFFGRNPDPARTRRYFIAAEPQLWDYAPEGRDPICGKPLPPPVQAQRRGGKIRYVEYTDETFTARVMSSQRLGILGPVLRGVVGDFLAITFLNRTSRPLSMHPHGVKYDKDSEGAYYEPKPGRGSAVGPGAKYTYVWQLDESSGPLPGEPSSKGWLYHSHVAGDEEAGLGLVGFIVVTDSRRARPDGTPDDVDREMASLFMIMDESGLGEAEREAAEYANQPGGGGPPPKTWAELQEISEQGERAAINGRIFGNLAGLEMVEGERVRWYLFGLGSQADFHTAHWHGVKVIEDGRRRTDVVDLLPATMKVADMVADNPGSWLFHCHVAAHMLEGMFARFVIHPRSETKPSRPGLEEPFFGVSRAQASLQVKKADAVLNGPFVSATNCDVTLEGTVTVFQAFSVFTQPVSVTVGQTTASFRPNRQGTAEAANGQLRIKNANQYGVVYGGTMDFELQLKGADWLGELRRLAPGGGPEIEVPVALRVGPALHNAKARVSLRSR